MNMDMDMDTENTRGRATSEAPSSSSSDLYDLDQPQETSPIQEKRPSQEPVFSVPATITAAAAAATDATTAADPVGMAEDADDDSSSEMDCSSPSRPSTPVPCTAYATPGAQAGNKRKLSDANLANGATLESAEESAKKRKVSLPMAGQTQQQPGREVQLPPEIWQRVFLHLSPAMLCRCLRVSKDFQRCLIGMSASVTVRKDRPRAQLLDSESIWIQSRKAFFPSLPRPLARFSEHDMLQLIGGLRCQFCDRVPAPSTATTVLNAGPGMNGLRVIWPFGIRCCGLCLQNRVLKDVQVLGDPALGRLRNGVTHGFFSPDLHFAAESVRTIVPGGIPGHLRFNKIYYRPDLDAIRGEEESARALGPGAVDEWHKGLFQRGKDAMADSARWEKWELQSLRPGQNLAQTLREYDLASFPRFVEETQSKSMGVNGVQPTPAANGIHPLPQPVHIFQNGYPGHFKQPLQPPPFPPPQPHHFLSHLAQLPQQPFFRPIRNPHEVEEARQARKADIERRCRELEPPLEPNVLQHMESFQAAMQITTPMTDSAWDMLKPRILFQREAAELTEHERASQLAALQAALPSSGSDDVVPKSAKETYDHEYERAQEPLRKQLGEYAEDYINGQWGGGKMLDKDNAPMFVIHALLHIRKRYTEDKQHGLLPRFEPPKRKEGARQGSPPVEPFLSLDNMKWVYDNKVRPLADIHRREHFVCAGCAEERKPKWFAFEGLIQHYGAKHTTTFSKGNIVVHWQTAEWPERPPFHTSPSQWLKLDRRTSDYKAHGRARNTPHHNHESVFPTPGKAHNLPDTPYLAGASGHSTVSPGYPSHFPSPAHSGTNGYFYPSPSTAGSGIDMSHDTQVTKLSSDSREIWDALDGIKDLLESIRVNTVMHHAISRFVDRFHQKPHLDLLTDALATNAQMRPLKNAHGLACKTCVQAQPSGVGNHGSYWIRIKSVKLYNTSSLITHFKLMHQPQGTFLDWTKDMVELPENQLIQELLRTPGMDDDKLTLIAAAFPSAFPSPLPRIGQVVEEPTEVSADGVPAKSLLTRLGKKQKAQHKKKVNGRHSNGVADRDDSQEPLPEPTEDEYDPRRPMFVQPKEDIEDPARFDTDYGRKPSALASSAPSAPAATGIMDLSPETLAALQQLGVFPTNAQPQAQPGHSDFNERSSRSPSVGRAEPSLIHAAPVPEAPMEATPATTTGPPDIAAILASLTGQPSPAKAPTSPDASSRRSGSAPRQQFDDHYGRSRHDHNARRPSGDFRPISRYEPTPPSAPKVPAIPDLQSLQAALAQNSRHHEQNQQHHTFAEAPYVSQPPPPYQQRYQYVYEGEQHYSQPPAHTPVYREAPVQYVPMPEREPVRYHYEHPAPPKPLYVDQYGRPLNLIPIDAAPAPVQYAPNPYEQQQYGRRAEHSMYTTSAPGGHLQAVYDDRRPVYYEPMAPHGAPRYAYEDARASVPRS